MSTEMRNDPSSPYAAVVWTSVFTADALVWGAAIAVGRKLAPTCGIPLSIMLALIAALLMTISLGAVIAILIQIADRHERSKS